MKGWIEGKAGRYLCVTIILVTGCLEALSQSKILQVSPSPRKDFTLENFQELIFAAGKFKSQTKIQSLSPVSYDGDSWQPGTWGRGYFTEFKNSDNASQILKPFIAEDSLRYWGCTPLLRYSGRMARAHMHARNVFPSLQNLPVIYESLDYLLSQQQQDGSFPYYKYRVDSTDLRPKKGKSVGEEEYETSEAVRALAEAFLYLESTETEYNKREELSTTIQESGTWLASRHNSWKNWRNNSNIPGFAAWALSAAFKVDNDSLYLTAIKNICRLLVKRQQKHGPNKGLWLTGATTVVNGDSVAHDSKIWYHAIILRGLVEALDVIPAAEEEVRDSVASAIKSGVNHIIEYRLRNEYPSVKEFPTRNSGYGCGGEAFFEMLALLAYNSIFHKEFSIEERNSLRNLLSLVSTNLTTEIQTFDHIQNLNAVAYYSNYMNGIANKTRVLHWVQNGAETQDLKITETVASGDFDNDSKANNLAVFYDSPYEGASLEVWRASGSDFILLGNHSWPGSKTYHIDSIQGRVLSGDFDADGTSDDIIAFYRKGPLKFEVHRWLSDKGTFRFSKIFTAAVPFDPGDKIVVGDFDEDGFNDDVAAFFPGSGGHSEVHLWKFDKGTKSFIFYNELSTGPYPGEELAGNVVAGDFDRDGIHDDLAAFFTAGNTMQTKYTKLYVWLSNGKGFQLQDEPSWNSRTRANMYDVNPINARIVSGDFNRDGFVDEISAIVAATQKEKKIYVWTSNGENAFILCDEHFALSTLPDKGAIAEEDEVPMLLSGDFDLDGSVNEVVSFRNSPSLLSKFFGWAIKHGTNFEFPGLPFTIGPGKCAITSFQINNLDSENHGTVTPPKDDPFVMPIPTRSAKTFSVYPNPSIGLINIETQFDSIERQIKVLNFAGETIYAGNLGSEQSRTIDLTKQPEGTYIIIIKDGVNWKTAKVFIHTAR